MGGGAWGTQSGYVEGPVGSGVGAEGVGAVVGGLGGPWHMLSLPEIFFVSGN